MIARGGGGRRAGRAAGGAGAELAHLHLAAALKLVDAVGHDRLAGRQAALDHALVPAGLAHLLKEFVGLELAARAGYDPQAGITLWQKMTQAAKGAPPTWLSTHPSGEDRERRTKAALRDVMPLYEKAKASKPAPPATAN